MGEVDEIGLPEVSLVDMKETAVTSQKIELKLKLFFHVTPKIGLARGKAVAPYSSCPPLPIARKRLDGNENRQCFPIICSTRAVKSLLHI